MTQLAVIRLEGIFCIVGRDGQARPIRLAGRPVRDFQPGWQPHGACDGFEPFVVLDLRHESGREASWLLTGALEHAPRQFGELSEAERRGIAAQAVPAIRAVHRTLLCAASPRLPQELSLFDGLNRAMIGEIVGLAAELAVGATAMADLQQPAFEPPRVGPLRLASLPAALGGNFQEALQDALHDGSLACRSPVDGRELRSRQSLVLHEHRLAYRFVDTRYDLVFFIGTTDYFFAKADLFVPLTNSVFTAHGDGRALGDLARQFLSHAIADAALLGAYLAGEERGDARPFAVVCRGYPDLHMGHQLWNELSALDRLVRQVPKPELPLVIVPNAASGSEVFAPLERIFPELEGRVDRALHSPETLGAYVYRKGYCLFRALDEHVTLSLARRIRDASALEEPPIRDDARLAARIAEQAIPCVLFGLRVENRTAIDPSAMIGDCIDHLRARLGKLVVVLDGHNARLHHDPVSHYQSFGQGMHEPPVFAELRLAMQLHRRFEGTDLVIVNLCGAAVSRSLFWATRADFFVAVWGAGLAKYRWVCNRPGLVLSNRWNLRHRGDLEIYHAARYQEGGAPMRFIDDDAITDLPEAPVQFAPVNPVPLYSNFQVDLAALRQALDGMVEAHLR